MLLLNLIDSMTKTKCGVRSGAVLTNADIIFSPVVGKAYILHFLYCTVFFFCSLPAWVAEICGLGYGEEYLRKSQYRSIRDKSPPPC